MVGREGGGGVWVGGILLNDDYVIASVPWVHSFAKEEGQVGEVLWVRARVDIDHEGGGWLLGQPSGPALGFL